MSSTNQVSHTRYHDTPHYAEGLHDLSNQVYAWMVPNGSWGESNAGLIVGQGESLLVDTLWDIPCTRAMLDAMRPIVEAAPIRCVVNTHADGDHWWGNALVRQARILTSRASLEEMKTAQPLSMVLLGQLGRLLSVVNVWGADQVGHWFQNMVAPYNFRAVTCVPATDTFEGHLTLQIGGREVRLIQAGPAHTQGDLIVHVPDARVLYAADIVFFESTPVMWAGPVENWLAALDMILDMDVETIVPGHGPLTDKRGVQQVKAYWEYVTAEVRRRYEAGLSAQQAARQIALSADFARQPFARWDSPERIMTNAHTLYGHWQGKPRPFSPPQIVNLLRKQALLANELPDAPPAVMRKRRAPAR